MDSDVVSIGYIKAKFALENGTYLGEQAAYVWANTFTHPRVTENFVYVSLGHKDLRDNKQGREYIKAIHNLGGKITRLDFFVDVLEKFDIAGYKTRMDEVYQNAPITARIGLPTLMTSLQGITCYIGKRSSARMLRVYDKRAEVLVKEKTDIEFDLTRFELEVKRELIPRYTTLFMSGQTQSILADIAERYRLPFLVDCPERLTFSEYDQKERTPFAFVIRYKTILRQAYRLNTTYFIQLMEGNDANNNDNN